MHRPPMPALLEQYRKAPNLVLNVSRTPTYVVANGFDGTSAWTQNPTGLVASVPSPTDQSRLRRAADLHEPINLRQQYRRFTLGGVEMVNERQAYVVYAYPQDDTADHLYFDTQSGLLLRKWNTLSSAAGDVPFQVDYDDYRDTGSGVKYPFVTRMNPATARSELQTSSTIRVQKVEDNASIEDATFVKPASKPTR